jgi:deoxyribodipyrimidine photo-lyase
MSITPLCTDSDPTRDYPPWRFLLESIPMLRASAELLIRGVCWGVGCAVVVAASTACVVRGGTDLAKVSRGRSTGRDWTGPRGQEGRTGYPIMDAAMRQLAAEWFIHNRVP